MKKFLSVIFCLALVTPGIALGVSSVSVVVTPDTATLNAQYEVQISLEFLCPENAMVAMKFPEAVRLPDKIIGGLVAVSELPVQEVSVSDRTVSFKLPGPLPDQKELSICIPAPCGLINPFKAGEYTLEITIDEESFRRNFQIKPILEQAPTVAVKPDKVGYKVGITIQINTPDFFSVVEGDAIDITFPPEFELPESIDPQYVFISGSKIAAGSIDASNIKLVCSQSVQKGEPVVISFEPSFGIKSPVWAGYFALGISIPGKMEEILSQPFQIQALSPTLTLSVKPEIDDGAWYSVKPKIEITSKAKREIYYYWDQDKKNLYKDPFEAEEGIHMLSYVGKVIDGGYEAVLSKVFKVDLTPPVFFPTPTAFNAEKVELVYRVKDVSPCESGISKDAAEALGDNTFKIDLALKPGPNDFVFWAVDSCQRISELRRTIILDVTPPTLIVEKPKPLQTVCGSIIEVVGKTEPDCSIAVNGSPADVSEKGEFKAAVSPGSEGPFDITVVAIDPAGNTTKKVIPVSYILNAKIGLEIGKVEFAYADSKGELEAVPYDDGGIAMVPFGKLADILGFRVLIKDNDVIVADKFSSKTVVLFIGSDKIKIRGEGNFEAQLSGKPIIKENILFVPLDFFDKGLGLQTIREENKITVLFCPRV
ncbi:MAG TPA: stalk domain-containing protein [Caldisericia bacterium]|nr:stalk domain-containing protein [Caldisericia bacterium]